MDAPVPPPAPPAATSPGLPAYFAKYRGADGAPLPAERAAHEGKLPRLRALLRAGAPCARRGYRDREICDDCALCAAVAGGRVDCARLLIDEGRHRLGEGCYDRTLTTAAGEGRPECIPLLLERGADPNGLPDDYGSGPPLFAACAPSDGADRGRVLECARLLLGGGASPNRATGEGCDFLLGEATRDPALLRLLLDAGGDPNGRDDSVDPDDFDREFAEPPIAAACRHGAPESLRMLLEAGACIYYDANVVDSIVSALSWSKSESAARACVLVLLERYPDFVERAADPALRIDAECLANLRKLAGPPVGALTKPARKRR